VDNGVYLATLVGESIVTSTLTLEDGPFMHKGLQKALGAFVLDSDVHAF
jgi:hypothetical protein